MSIKIIKAGLVATLQDTGRQGYRPIGVGRGGAMDPFAIKVANYLCGNDENQAVIEMNFPAPEIGFREDTLISLAGADLAATINGEAIPCWQAVEVKKDSMLKFNRPVSGARSYLAVHGGWQADKWLDSYSTHLKLAAGGHLGRALQKDDIINFRANDLSIAARGILSNDISRAQLDKIYRPANNIRCIKGVEYELMDERSKKDMEEINFTVNSQSDRMGFRLNNAALLLKEPADLISSAVDAGTVQLLPGGNCIILMADHQTTGGYPRIASIIKADLPKLAQVKPGQAINFTLVSLQEAEDAFLDMQQTLKEIKKNCLLNLEKYFQ